MPLSRSIVNIGQTFPPVAVLALAVPIVGFGEKPTLIALFLYGLLPIFENALTGLTQSAAGGRRRGRRHGHDRDAAAVEGRSAAGASGDPRRRPACRRSSALATATIGSTVAAKGLGEVIIAGLLSNNLAFVVQGGVIVAMLAVTLYEALSGVERIFARRAGRIAEEREKGNLMSEFALVLAAAPSNALIHGRPSCGKRLPATRAHWAEPARRLRRAPTPERCSTWPELSAPSANANADKIDDHHQRQ